MKRTCIAFLCLIVGIASVQAYSQTIRTVALSKQLPPAAPLGEEFYSVWQPIIDNQGRVSFFASTRQADGQLDNNVGLWTDDGSSLELIARESDPAPGYPGGTFYDLTKTSMNTSTPPEMTLFATGDHAILHAMFLAPTDNDKYYRGAALWRIDGKDIQFIAGKYQDAPGAPPSTTFLDIHGVVFNAAGRIAFGSSTQTNQFITFDGGIWTDVRGELELVARSDQPIPGMPNTAMAFFSEAGYPALGSSGILAFRATIKGLAPSSPNQKVILSGHPGALRAIVREGEQAPGAPSGSIFKQFLTSGYETPAVDSCGRVLFQAKLTGDEVSQSNETGFWLEDAGTISLVARYGDQAADLPMGVNYNSLAFPKMNSHGDIAMHGILAGTGIDSTNNRAIWAGTSDSLHVLARIGEPAPGLSDDEVFTLFRGFSLNETGRVALVAQFPGYVQQPDFIPYNHGIWAQDASGELQLIVKTGDMLEVAPGDFRSVTQVDLGGFNDHGQIVFKAYFHDDLSMARGTYSGIFVSNLVAVPEPSSWILMVACLAACRALRRGKIVAFD
jgi:hypothetical protein